MLAHYEKGSESKITIVLSCPGKKEQELNKPASGVTGEHLEYLLSKLREKYSHTDFQRGKITIANAWKKIEFKGKNGTGRSEPTLLEVLDQDNLNRLSNDIENTTDYIICCGKNAKASLLVLKYADKIDCNCKVIYIPHLSTRGLCRSIFEDIGGTAIKPQSSNGITKRLDVVADNINKDMK